MLWNKLSPPWVYVTDCENVCVTMGCLSYEIDMLAIW